MKRFTDTKQLTTAVAGQVMEQVKTFEEQEERIFSILFDDLDEVLPSLSLRAAGNGDEWRTTLHKDGPTDSDNKLTSSIYRERPHVLIDHARGGKRLIWHLVDTGVYPDYLTAIQSLCGLANVEAPVISDDLRAKVEADRKATALVNALHSDLIACNPDPVRSSVIAYLKDERKWTGPNIVHSALGYITREKAKDIGWNDTRIGTTHRLAIPLYYADRMRGWTFRATAPNIDKDKRYLKVTGEQYNFLAGLPAKVRGGVIVVVEGAMDATHVAALDQPTLPPVVATLGGSGLTADMVNDAIRRGTDTFILGFDNDEGGRRYAREAAKRIWEAGATALRLHYPDGCKDLDEALKSNRTDFDLFKAVEDAEPYALVRANEMLSTNEIISVPLIRTAKEMAELIDTCDPIGKTAITYALDRQTDKQGMLLKGLIDEKRRENAIRQARADTYRRAGDFVAQGYDDKAARALHALTYADTTDFFKPQSVTAFESQYPFVEPVQTPYVLYSDNGRLKARVTLKRSAVTAVGARSGHGKTAFMISLACYLLKEGKSIVYCTAECNERQIMERFIDIHAGVTGEKKGAARATIDKYLQAGTLRLYRLRDAERACNIAKALKPDVMFIDYIQLLRIKGFFTSKKDRLEGVCGALEEAVTALQTAFVIGVQLNRNDTPDPLAMNENSIADAIDIEQFADSIYLLWSSSRKIKHDKSFSDRREAVLKEYPNLPFERAGGLLVKCVKARDAVMGYDYRNVFASSPYGAVTDELNSSGYYNNSKQQPYGK